jgi:hypothetical protein
MAGNGGGGVAVMRLGSGRRLATPVIWYRHALTRRTLVVILNSHIGDREYWDTMRRRIGQMEERGAEICVEGVHPADEAVWAEATDDERAARKFLAYQYDSAQADEARHLGWIHQGDERAGLCPRSTWRNVDLTDLEVIRLAGVGAFSSVSQAGDEQLAKLGKHADAYNAAYAALYWRRLAQPGGRVNGWVNDRVTRLLARFIPEGSAAVSDVLVPQRSKLAVAGVSQDRDTVLIYGAGHAASIDEALDITGWVRTGKLRWLVVGTLPPLARSLGEVARELGGIMIDTYRAAWAAIDADGSLWGCGRSGPGLWCGPWVWFSGPAGSTSGAA